MKGKICWCQQEGCPSLLVYIKLSFSNGMTYLPKGGKAFIAMVSESYSWSFLIDAQVRNCDAVVCKILMDLLFQWLQEGLNR